MGWSLDSWGSDSRLSQADQFLNTGIVGTAFGGTGCTSSSQCASGYKCSGGRCVQVTTDGGSGGSGGSYGSSGGVGSGRCDGGPDGSPPGSGAGTGGCSSPNPVGGGGGGGCTTSTCGQGTYGYGEDSDCCGERCCRYFATGIPSEPINVNCYCGNCPGTNGSRCGDGYSPCGPGLGCVNGYCTKPKACSKWCTEYYEANGELGPGCSRDWICDECTECTGQFDGGGNYCESKASLPCHCNGAELEECDICNSDGSVTQGTCLECCNVMNYPCECGKTVNATACQPVGTSGLSICNIMQIAAAQKCAEECATTPDPCAPSCEPKRQTSPGPCPENPTAPAAQDGFDNTWTGCIDAGDGNHVTLYDECDYSNLPEGCGECDCNCDYDCDICEYCNEEGKCVSECVPPSGNGITTWTFYIPSYTVYGITQECAPASSTTVPEAEVSYTTACGPTPHRLEEVSPCVHIRGSITNSNGCAVATTSPSSGADIQAAQYRVLDADGNVIASFDGNQPNGWSGGAHPSSTSPGCVVPIVSDITSC